MRLLLGSCGDLGARVTASREGPQDSGFTWPRAPRPAVPGRSGPSSPIQPLTPRATHTWLPLPGSPGTGGSLQQLLEGPVLAAQALQDLLVGAHAPACCFGAMAPLRLESTLPTPFHRTTAAASWPFLPRLPNRPLAPPSTPPPHISPGPPTSSCQPPSPPPSFSHQHLNPADCSHPLDSCHRT